MNTITQQQIGERLKKAREMSRLSQEALGNAVDLPRHAITQIENGQRKLSSEELIKCAQVLNFSLDDFNSSSFLSRLDNTIINVKESETERISVPSLSINKFKTVLLYILEKCAGKPNIGETALNKLLYFSDFNYYELYEEQLTGAEYKKLQFGPVPETIKEILTTLEDEGKILRLKTEYFNFQQTRFIPLDKADLKILKASEIKVIDDVIDRFSEWSASKLSDYSHKDMPWLSTEDNEVIDYELVFYREAPFSVRNYLEDEYANDI